jgi:hypothetical protein
MTTRPWPIPRLSGVPKMHVTFAACSARGILLLRVAGAMPAKGTSQ